MPVIKVENLSKNFILRHKQEGSYTALRDVVAEKFRAAGRRILNPFILNRSHRIDSSKEDFWALREVSFAVNQGDRIGIIGRNGAGKSTLLKILSRITEPTSGRVSIIGRVASLLEVGTGFHPELTGRENVYLNGAILGMTKAEIRRKFDEIITFAEVEKFLDTPVKRYSSGMYVRLAFSVAAHLEPEILVVDEVLSVGDAQFQEKCLGKMKKVGQEGRTILFVSHNMTVIKTLCNRGILLQNGKNLLDGTSEEAVLKYTEEIKNQNQNTVKISQKNRMKNCSLKAQIIDIAVSSSNGKDAKNFDSSKGMTIEITIDAQVAMRTGAYLAIRDSYQVILWFDSGHLQKRMFYLNKGINVIRCHISPTYLSAGSYAIDCGLTIPNQEWIDLLTDTYHFTVLELDPYRSGFNLTQTFARYHVDHDWEGPSNETIF
jgi:lipopolysaccharide transport system ATP-binding protein